MGLRQWRSFHQIHTDISQRGRYCHAFTMTVMAERDHPSHPALTDDAEDTVTEAFRDLARWFYARLREECAYLTLDEAVDEAVVANDYYTFDLPPRFRTIQKESLFSSRSKQRGEQRMRKSRFTEEQIVGVLQEYAAGAKVSELRRLKDLEAGNPELKRLLADAIPDNAGLKGLLAKTS